MKTKYHVPAIPEYLSQKLELIALTRLTPKILMSFSVGLLIVNDELQAEDALGLDTPLIHLILIDELSSLENNPDITEECINMSVLPVRNLFKTIMDYQIFVFVKKLVECFWHLEDESLIEEKCLKIINRVHPKISMTDIRCWMNILKKQNNADTHTNTEIKQ